MVELEKSMVQETLAQYDINTPIIERGGEIYRQTLRQEKIILVQLESGLHPITTGACPTLN